MEELIAALLRLGAPQLVTERAAIRLFIRVRWRNGLRCPWCGGAARRDGVNIRCDACPAANRRRHATIFIGTPLEDLRKPRVRALLLAIRAFAVYPAGIAARVLARDLRVPRMTCWRHNHILREMLPRPAALATILAAATQVCGKRRRRRRSRDPERRTMYRPQPAFVVVGAYNAVRASATRPPTQGRHERMVAENLHSWLVGTHHGVTADWLPSYCCEFASRSYCDPEMNLRSVAAQLCCPPPTP